MRAVKTRVNGLSAPEKITFKTTMMGTNKADTAAAKEIQLRSYKTSPAWILWPFNQVRMCSAMMSLCMHGRHFCLFFFKKLGPLISNCINWELREDNGRSYTFSFLSGFCLGFKERKKNSLKQEIETSSILTAWWQKTTERSDGRSQSPAKCWRLGRG